jgi:hypothetical protein
MRKNDKKNLSAIVPSVAIGTADGFLTSLTFLQFSGNFAP